MQRVIDAAEQRQGLWEGLSLLGDASHLGVRIRTAHL